MANSTEKRFENNRHHCVIFSCRARQCDHPGRKFFKFRKPGSGSYNLWKEKCIKSKDAIENCKVPYICSIHFEKRFLGIKYLRKNAIPTCFLEENWQNNDNRAITPPVQLVPESVKRTYSRSKTDADVRDKDFTIEELNQMCKYLPNRNDEIGDKCESCEYRAKNLRYHAHQTTKLKNKLKNTQKENAQLKKTIKILKSKVVKLRNKTIPKANIKQPKSKILTLLNDLPNASKNSKVMAKMILNENVKEYDEDERSLSQAIYFKSASSYKNLRNNLNIHLPHPRSLYNWMEIKNLSPGYDDNVLQKVKIAIEGLDQKSRNVTLCWDEFSCQEHLEYSAVHDRIDGYEDYGNGIRTSAVAKYICVFMVRSLCGTFKHVLNYVLTPTSIPVDHLEDEIKKAVQICEHLGLIVRAGVCDQGPTNRAFFKKMNISEVQPFFSMNGNIIFSVYDYCHLYKSCRNTLLSYKLTTPDGIVSI